MVFRIGKKKYRIRTFSPAWWTTVIGGTVLAIVGAYCWILLLYAMCPNLM